MRHAILPRMSSYRVMHTDYIHTHVHTLNTNYVHMCTIPCNPHLTIYRHFRRLSCRQIACTACSVLPCICHSIRTVSHACIVCIYITTNVSCSYGMMTCSSSVRILATFDDCDLKELQHVLGMEVKRDGEATTLSNSHKQMITDLLGRNNMLGCRCSPTPLVPREKMSLSEDPTQENASVSDHKRFIKVVGSTYYIAAGT